MKSCIPMVVAAAYGLVAWPALAQMLVSNPPTPASIGAATTTLSNIVLPDAPNNLLANTVAHIYFAKAYGACAWATDGSGDNSPCILTAIAAAKLDVIIAGDAFRIGGAEVILPATDIGIAATILQTGSPAITLRGAGAPGGFGYCKTRLSWTGAASGDMVQFGNDVTALTVGGGVQGMCIDGKSVAGRLLVGRSNWYGRYNDLFLHNSTIAALDWDVSAVDSWGSAHNRVTDTQILLDSAGAINSKGVVWGPGTAANDVFNNIFDRVIVNYQNGVGWDCGNSDTNWVRSSWSQAMLGGTGRSLHLRAGADPETACRENKFEGFFGLGGTTMPLAENGTLPSFNNYLNLNGFGSGAQPPTIQAGATLGYDTDTGIHFDNRVSSTSFTHGGMVYKATPGDTTGVFDIDTANLSNGALSAKLGPTLPLYMFYNNPQIGFNMYFGAGQFRYGKGSANKYAALMGFDAAIGQWKLSSTAATGNTDEVATPVTSLTVAPGLVSYGTTATVPAHIASAQATAPALTSCGGGSPAISGTDTAGTVTMGTTATGCVITFNVAYTTAPHCVVTWRNTPLLSQSYTVSTAAITLTQTSTSGDLVDYICIAPSGG